MMVDTIERVWTITQVGGIVRLEREGREIAFFEPGPEAEAFLLEYDCAVLQDRIVPFFEDIERGGM